MQFVKVGFYFFFFGLCLGHILTAQRIDGAALVLALFVWMFFTNIVKREMTKPKAKSGRTSKQNAMYWTNLKSR